jgi:hypothetical protein
MPTISSVSGLLGHQHHSKPVTDEDKSMSKVHKKHRKAVDKMSKKTTKDKVKALKKSIEYNDAHAQEHLKAIKDRRKELVKMKVKV